MSTESSGDRPDDPTQEFRNTYAMGAGGAAGEPGILVDRRTEPSMCLLFAKLGTGVTPAVAEFSTYPNQAAWMPLAPRTPTYVRLMPGSVIRVRAVEGVAGDAIPEVDVSAKVWPDYQWRAAPGA